jgi:hypothetical protein
MRALVILLLSVTTAAVEDVATEEAFPPPSWYGATTVAAPSGSLQGLPLTETDWEVPAHLAAWPKNPADGRPAECWTNTPLIDVGGCYGLTEVKNIATAQECASQCEEEPLCPSYQFSDDGCFMGSGTKCNAARPDLVGLQASRFMSGQVSVLMNTYAKGIQVMGLKPIGHFKDANGTLPDVAYGIERCKDYCYSNILCQYWQFFEGDAADKGCFVDDGTIASLLDGKLTKGVDWVDTNIEPGLKAGEFVQHFCPAKPTEAPTTVAPTEPPPPDYTWLWITLGVIAAAILAGILYYLLQPKPKPKVRAVKPKPPPAKEPVPVYRTVIPAYGVPTPNTYQGTTTAYTGDPHDRSSFVITRSA